MVVTDIVKKQLPFLSRQGFTSSAVITNQSIISDVNLDVLANAVSHLLWDRFERSFGCPLYYRGRGRHLP
jgi:uncharacterized protein (DUF934 family)